MEGWQGRRWHPDRMSPHWWEVGGVKMPQDVFNSLDGFSKGRPSSTAQFLPAVLVCNTAIPASPKYLGGLE